MTAGGNDCLPGGRAVPTAAARLVESLDSRNENVTATLLRFACRSLTDETARGYAVTINLIRDLHGEPAAVIYARRLVERINR